MNFMIHRYQELQQLQLSVQDPFRMNLILANFELSNGSGQIVKVQLNEEIFKPVIE